MKRYFLFVVAAMLCLPMVAGTTIQREFFGCELGKSSKMECMIKCLETGVITGADNFSLAFDGKYVVDGYEFRSTATTFQNDTLFMVAFSDTLVSEHPEAADAFLNRLRARYNDIPGSGFDDLMGKAFLDTLCTQGNIDTSRVWSKAYGPTMVILVLNEDRFGLIYLDIDFLWRKFYKSFMDGFSSLLGPDYDPVNEVKGVVGCNFGESKQSVMAKFRLRSESLIKDEGQHVLFYKVSLGGNTFKRANLYFKGGKFVSCSFETEFYTWKSDEARSLYKILCDQYSRKYSNAKFFDKDPEDLFSTYGMLQSDYKEGKLPPIVISCSKSLSAGGDYYYYVTVSYFSRRISTLYDDEI